MRHLLCLTLTLIWFSWSCAQENSRKGQSAASELFPPQVKAWKQSRAEYDLGIREAETLRRQLVRQPSGESSQTAASDHVENLAKVIAAFQEQLGERQSLVPIANFRATASRLSNQLQGKETLDPRSVFEAFSGRWYGVWDQTAVNHDWHSTRVQPRPLETSESHLFLCSDQYAWIHNGFGWNYLVSHEQTGAQNYVLGQVYYLNDRNLDEISGRKPHVGYVDLNDNGDPPTRLIWITEFEIFLEEVFPQLNRDEDYYVITAIYHRLFDSSPTVSRRGTQAKYTRKSSDRPAFIEIEWVPPGEFSSTQPRN